MLDAMADYLESMRNDEYTDNTVAQYERHLNYLREYLLGKWFAGQDDVPVASVTVPMLKAYNASLKGDGMLTRSRATYLAPVRSFFDYLCEMQVIKGNPAAKLRSGRESKQERAAHREKLMLPKYTAEDFEALLTFLRALPPTKVNLRNIAVLTLFVASGLRAFELCSLNVSDMDAIRDGTLHCIQKGGYKTIAAVAPFCIPFIERYLENRGSFNANEPLFLSQKGCRLTPNSCWKALATAQHNAPGNLSTGIHCFRALALTSVNEIGNVAIARDAGRHKHATTTQDHYLKTTTAQVKEALNSTSIATFVRSQHADSMV